MDEWEQRSYVRDVKVFPSTSNPIIHEKSGWKAWAQAELYYYALGQGYGISLERPPAVNTGTSKDLQVSMSEKGRDYEIVLAMLDTKGGDVSRDFQRECRNVFRDWFETFDAFARHGATASG